MTPARAARAEGVAAAEAAALLADTGFADLVAARRELDALPEAERVERLVRLACARIENARRAGDWRVAAFVLAENRRGRDPVRTVAERVLAVPPAGAGADGRVPPPAPAPERNDVPRASARRRQAARGARAEGGHLRLRSIPPGSGPHPNPPPRGREGGCPGV